jgi:hypothetical protein
MLGGARVVCSVRSCDKWRECKTKFRLRVGCAVGTAGADCCLWEINNERAFEEQQ